MNRIVYVLLVSALLAGPARAQQPATPATATSASTDMADGEVRKIDKDANKITLRHGEIKSLDMPRMTMVFQVKDAALLEKVKVGDKVRFRAEKSGGGYVVTAIETAN